MVAIILLLTTFGICLPDESWLNKQFEELRLRTEPGYLIFPATKPHSVSDLRKYVETSTGEERTASLLKQRIEKYLEGFEGYGGDLEFRSDSISRLFASPHYGRKLNGSEIFLQATLKLGKSNEYPSQVWEDIAASDYMRAYLRTGVKRFSFLFGRERLKWGASPISPLLLSGGGPPFDMVCANYRTDRFQFSSFFTALSPHGDTSRYLSGHRIEFALFSTFSVGLSEIVLHGGCNKLPDPYYFNPLVIFYPREWNKGRAIANILWGIDFNYLGTGWSGYGELMLDDYPYEVSSMNEHPKLGWILGVRMLDFLRQGEYIVVEYAGVHRWCYGHAIPWQRYTHRGYPIGHPLGNDFDHISVNATEHLSESLDIELSAHYTRKGEGRVYDPYPDQGFPDPYFLTGVVEKRMGMGVGARYMMSSLWTVELMGGWENTNDYGNQRGDSRSQPSIRFRLEKLFR